MFYCDECAEKQGWPITMFKSGGVCEVCETAAVCNDRPSRLLPSPKQPLKQKPAPEFKGTFTCTGSHESHAEPHETGTDISLYRHGEEWPWIDLIELHYHPFSAEEKAALQRGYMLKASDPHTVANRRLNRAQAFFLRDKIIEFLNREFADGIPTTEHLPQKYRNEMRSNDDGDEIADDDG